MAPDSDRQFVVDPEDMSWLIPRGWWCLASERSFTAFRTVTEQAKLERGVGLPGRVLATGEPAWIPDLSQDGNFPRYHLADDVVVRSGFAFPVLAGDEVVAVLEFYACEPTDPDQELLAVIANVGTQLGRVFERERTARELQRTNSISGRLLNRRVASSRSLSWVVVTMTASCDARSEVHRDGR